MGKKLDDSQLYKEDLDKLRHIEGFPLGKDEDIIALSDPPYYTACPNPFVEGFIEKYGTRYDEKADSYHKEPFAADVSEGKNNPIYNAHSYHTKVPHKAIMRYILHYTEPGDIVFDGFCGTGMTGVAAQMCGIPSANPEFKFKIEQEMPDVKWGSRKAILSDLSPAATFIAYNYNTPVDVEKFEKEANKILDECENELGWMYETNHIDEHGRQVEGIAGPVKGKINYTVWSDVFICPNCSAEIIFWDVAIDKKNGKVSKEFNCQNCDMLLKKTDCERAMELVFDEVLNKNITMAKQVPVMINYVVGKKRFEKLPDIYDLEIIEKINNIKIPYWYPTDRMIEGSESRRNDKYGITHIHHFFYKKNLAVLAAFWNKIGEIRDKKQKYALFSLATGVMLGLSKLQRFRLFSTFPNMILSGTLYVGSTIREWNSISWIRGKIRSIVRMKNQIIGFNSQDSIIETVSMNNLSIKKNSIDYIFTDPPFGANLNYSELSFIWEAWLRVVTNNKSEAIINSAQGKNLAEYQGLMTDCFRECYRVLKPNRWMTVEFSNSQNSVWNAIQESLIRAGFVVADVRILDKKQGSFKQVNYSSAVKQDLVISAYKPKESFVERFLEKTGTEESAWEFIREHLEKLPVVIQKTSYIERVGEREAHALFDKMVAYHVVNGIAVPLDIRDFFEGLEERFLKRDNMYFLHSQVNEYDNARIISDLPEIQFDMFVDDEKSALAWLYYQLETPQIYSELLPKFMKEAKPARHEKMPELMEMLEENFLKDDEDRWYIPDPTKSGDIIKLREKKLLKEFEEYLKVKGKLRIFRTEAIRVGFAKLWEEKNYKLLVKTAERIPEKVLQEDDKLLMYYDISLSRME